MPVRYKVMVYIPAADAEKVKAAALEAGAGRIGAYGDVCFSIPGLSQFRPNAQANPAIGKAGQLEQVHEVKLEMTVEEPVVREVLAAIRGTHPYEEVVVDVYRLEDM